MDKMHEALPPSPWRASHFSFKVQNAYANAMVLLVAYVF